MTEAYIDNLGYDYTFGPTLVAHEEVATPSSKLMQVAVGCAELLDATWEDQVAVYLADRDAPREVDFVSSVHRLEPVVRSQGATVHSGPAQKRDRRFRSGR